jgi:archaellum component FlaG (FlaF/FlaG flagellin family)
MTTSSLSLPLLVLFSSLIVGLMTYVVCSISTSGSFAKGASSSSISILPFKIVSAPGSLTISVEGMVCSSSVASDWTCS